VVERSDARVEHGKGYAALLDGTVKASDDSGATFTDLVRGG
jgi:hypothetical protein